MTGETAYETGQDDAEDAARLAMLRARVAHSPVPAVAFPDQEENLHVYLYPTSLGEAEGLLALVVLGAARRADAEGAVRKALEGWRARRLPDTARPEWLVQLFAEPR